MYMKSLDLSICKLSSRRTRETREKEAVNTLSVIIIGRRVKSECVPIGRPVPYNGNTCNDIFEVST